MNQHIQSVSPFGLVGATLVANGFSAIPIAPGEKRPDPCLGTEWQRYCSRLPTKLEIESWSKRSVGVGVALGAASRGLVAIDIDSDQLDVIEAIESRWPSTMHKVGKKGYSAFYCASSAVKSRAFKSGTHGGVDFLAHGRQSVLPPTLHSATGEAYRWLTPRTLENTIIDELPILPDDIAAQLAEALEPFGFAASPERRALVREPVGAGDSIWDDVKATALANLDAWVPHLGIDARREGASWRGVAIWRDGKNHNVSFHPNGIKDYGDGEKGYNAIDVAMLARGMSNGEALDWLKERLGFEEPEPIKWVFDKPEEEEDVSEAGADAPQSSTEPGVDLYLDDTFVAGIISAADRFPAEVFWRHWVDASIAIQQSVSEADFTVEVSHIADWMEQAVNAIAPPAEAPRKSAKRDPLDAITLGQEVDWLKPDGLLGEMTDWILETSQSPNRPLAVAAADATLAAAAGRANLYGPTSAALNVYTVLLGKTTIGKDRALKAVEEILSAASLKIGGDGYSISAMEGMLADSPAVIMTVDEIAKNLFPRMLGGRANSHETAILGFLLKLFTRYIGNTPYTSTRRSPKSILQHVSIDSPQFSLLGASTPEGFYGALQAGNVDDGFMNRLIAVEAAPRMSNDAPRRADVPVSISDALGAIVLETRDISPGAIELRPAERVIPWASPDVEREWQGLRDRVYAIIDAVPTKEGNLYGRIAEQTTRFAARHALSRDGAAAKVGMPDLEWGAAFVLQSARTLRDGAAEMMADNEFEKNVNAILRLARKHGEIMLSELANAVRIEPVKRKSALDHLQTALQIEMVEKKTPGRSGVIIRYIGG